MFKLHDFIPASPQSISESKLRETAGKAEVVYIHPLGRFYTLEFTYPGGKFRESRFFSETEKEIGARQGLFQQRPSYESTAMRPTSCQRSFAPPATPKTPFGGYDDDFDDSDAAAFF